MLRAILLALADGPATATEIEQRIGYCNATSTAHLCRTLERQGKVIIVGRRVARAGPMPLIWALAGQGA